MNQNKVECRVAAGAPQALCIAQRFAFYFKLLKLATDEKHQAVGA